MKTIDWKEVSCNQDLSKNFTHEVYNKFQSLSPVDIDADNVDDVYNSLIKSTEEVALATLPKNKGRGQAKSSSSPNVVEARNNLKSISIAYHKSPTQAKKIQLIMAKKTLDDAYLDSEVNFINGKINDLSRHHISEKHHLAWKTIKELSGKNSNSAIRIKGGSSKKRLEN